MSAERICHVPRCNEPAAPHRGDCITHAVEYADRKLAEAQHLRDWLAQYERGQLTLLAGVSGSGSGTP